MSRLDGTVATVKLLAVLALLSSADFVVDVIVWAVWLVRHLARIELYRREHARRQHGPDG